MQNMFHFEQRKAKLLLLLIQTLYEFVGTLINIARRKYIKKGAPFSRIYHDVFAN